MYVCKELGTKESKKECLLVKWKCASKGNRDNMPLTAEMRTQVPSTQYFHHRWDKETKDNSTQLCMGLDRVSE